MEYNTNFKKIFKRKYGCAKIAHHTFNRSFTFLEF